MLTDPNCSPQITTRSVPIYDPQPICSTRLTPYSLSDCGLTIIPHRGLKSPYMHGLNKQFVKDPEGFLRRYVIDEKGNLAIGAVLAGVYDFDFVPNKDNKKIAELHKVDPDKDAGETLIKAYWLPWGSKKTREIELGDDANYFFTSFLGGCRLQIVPAGSKVKILHIAGDKGGEKGKEGEGPEGAAWREKQASKKLGPALQRSRAFSSSTPVFKGGYREYREVCVVGFVTKPEKESTPCWEFWAQAREGSEQTFDVWVDATWKVWTVHLGEKEGAQSVIHGVERGFLHG